MPSPIVTIPRPCPVSQQALTPTEAGWHCARCQTEVIDFTRLSETEVLAYLAERPGQRVCAAMQMPLMPQQPRQPKGLRRWLLVLATLLGGPRLAAWAELPPVPLTSVRLPFFQHKSAERVVVRGTVLDASRNVPRPGIYIFISGTKYGAVTDEHGEFVLSLPANWELIKQGEVLLDVRLSVRLRSQGKLVVVKIVGNAAPAPLTIRLPYVPESSFYLGKIAMEEPPVAPPASVPDSSKN